VVSAADEAVLESLVADTAAGLLVAANQGAAVTLLGRGFRPDPSVAPGYDGPSFDIFEVAAEVPTRPDRLTRGKRFYFDTDTGLLHSTRYEDRGQAVETRFSDWARIDGSFHPGRIERFENGTRMFSFIATGVSASPAIDDDTFVQP